MDKQELSLEDVINFSCDHCGISLTVDDSLAGVTGPCPSCGESVTAPVRSDPSKIPMKPRTFKDRSESSSKEEDGDVKMSSRQSSEGDFSSSRRRRSVRADGALSKTNKERAELAAVVKILVSGLIVLAIVLAVAYWLNNHLKAV